MSLVTLFLPSGTVTIDLVPAEGAQAQSSDTPTLVRTYVLTSAEGAQGQSSDVPTLVRIYVLTSAEGSQTQGSDVPILISMVSLVSQDGRQTQRSDSQYAVRLVDAEGGAFYMGEFVGGSVGGSAMFTVSDTGILKEDGSLYSEGETGTYQGKRYCSQHMSFVLSQEKYNYNLNLTGLAEADWSSEGQMCFDEGETITGSVGGADMMTVDVAGIVKVDGLVYPEGETGIYQGKRYCTQHLNFMLGKDKYSYRLDLED